MPRSGVFSRTLKQHLPVHLSLFTVSLIYGATFTIAKEVMPHYIAPYGFILLRVATACLLFLAFHALFIREKIHRKDILPFAISAFFGVAANMLMFFKGLALTTPVNGAVLMLVTPVFVLLTELLRSREMPGMIKTAGVLLACTGAVLLIAGKEFSFHPETALGDLLILLNAVSYAVYLVHVKSLLKRYHPVTVSKWNFLLGVFMVLPFGFHEMKAVNWQSFEISTWIYVGFVLFGTTFLTYLLNAYALQKAPAALVGAYIYLQPVVAVAIALISGKDQLSMEKIIFTLLIFTGVYLVSRKQKSTSST